MDSPEAWDFAREVWRDIQSWGGVAIAAAVVSALIWKLLDTIGKRSGGKGES